MNVNQSSDNLKDEILLHIYKKRKTDYKDELKTYLRKLIISLKTDILL